MGFCEGCHSVHNSVSPGTAPKFSPTQSSTNGGVSSWTGTPVNPNGTAGNGPNEFLLRGSDDSSTCLNCHAQKGVPYRVLSVDGNVNNNPAGDFYWLSLTVTYTALENGSTYVIKGQDHGHDVIAKDFGLTSSTIFANAPGGTYPASALMCTSCHDPHGRVNGGTKNGSKPISGSGSYGGTAPSGTILGNYRLLGDNDYQGNSLAPYTFTYAAPMAAADSNPAYNFSETADNKHHVDYGTLAHSTSTGYSDMSNWCENCHPWQLFAHHPVSPAEGSLNNSYYNVYIATGNLKGASSYAWLSLVPFERTVTGVTQLNGETQQGAPSGQKCYPSCITCHRAHASAFQRATRWDTRATFLTNSIPGGIYNTTTEYSPYGAYIANAPYYGRPINEITTNAYYNSYGPNPYQRQLCNKCHSLDFDDYNGYLPGL